MKIVTHIARTLLGLLFVVFGLNGFLHFLPQPPLPPGHSVQFFTVMVESHYLAMVFFVQLVAGILFLANQYVPFALTIIGPVIVNILIFHGLMNPEGIAPGLLATVLWFIVFYSCRSAFAGIFQRQVAD